MLERCYNPKHQGYPEYGERGITVHALWNPRSLEKLGHPKEACRSIAFRNFLEHVGIKPSWRHTLDRISAEGNYAPGNVQWATPKEQGVNKRDTHFVLHPRSGVRIAAATLADEMKITYHQLRIKMIKDGSWYALRFESVQIKEPTK